MPTLSGFARLGRDAEMKYLEDGTPFAEMALAFNYGRKGDDGKRPTQWVNAVMWGARSEALAPYLLKGVGICVMVDDVHIETFTKRDGVDAAKLVGKVMTVELTGSAPQSGQGGTQQTRPATQQRAAPAAQRQPQTQQRAASPSPNFADMDDDIPF